MEDGPEYESTSELGAKLRDGVLRLTFLRPKTKNALNDAMVTALIAHLQAANSDERVRAIVFTGEGDDFCSGFDIISRNAPGAPRPRAGAIQRRLPSQAHRLIPLVLDVQVPVVLAARGWVAGIGLNLALAADFAVVATDATMWAPFTSRGFTPDSGAAWLLPRRIGEVRARRMLLSGERVSGTTAAEWGMVHQAVPATEVAPTADALATTLAAGPTVALGLTKWLLHSGATSDLTDHLAREALAMEISSRAEDFREGLAAFAEKRPPEFRGR